MRTRKLLYFVIALSFTMHHGVAAAGKDDANLADDIEMPDMLLQETDSENKNKSSKGGGVFVSGEGANNNDIVKPDPLESSLDGKDSKSGSSKDIELKVNSIKRDDKAINKSSLGTEKANDRRADEQEMPDPLLDSMQ